MKKGYTGFSFRGTHTDDFDGIAAVRTDDRPIRPETKETTFSPLNRDGSYSFAAANPLKREYYEDRVFSVKIKVRAADIYELQDTLTLLSRWLRGSGDLIFDDIPNVKWTARVIEAIPYSPERGGLKAELDVKYRALPFSELAFDTFDGPALGSDISLGSDVPLDMSAYFRFSGGGTYTVKNVGDVPARPQITVTSEDTAAWIALWINNSRVLKVPPNSVIDCGRCVVTDLSGKSVMDKVEGDFFELQPGDNELMVMSVIDFKIEVRYSPKYLYSAYLKEMGFE